MKTITVYDHELKKHHEIPSKATHYMFASGYGVYYKIGDTWIHQGDKSCQQVIYDFDASDYSQRYSKKIFEVQKQGKEKGTMKAFGKYDLPENTTHVAKGRCAGCYYKTSDNELWRFVNDFGNECYGTVINMDTQSHLGINEVVCYITKSNPEVRVDIDNECKERAGQVLGSLQVGESFISSGVIKKNDIVKGSGWRIGDSDGFSSRFVMAHTKTDLDLLSEFVPDFTKHKDCDIVVIRDIVEQYRNKIKQLQEIKK